MKKRTILSLIALVVMIVSFVMLICVTHSPAKDYTKAYSIYNAVKQMTALENVKDYLKENNLEYVIKDRKICIKQFSDLEFELSSNGNCSFCKSSVMEGLNKVDKETFGEVTIKGEMANGKITEIVSYKSWGKTFSKENGKFYYSNPFSSISVISFLALIISLLVLRYNFKALKRQKLIPEKVISIDDDI